MTSFSQKARTSEEARGQRVLARSRTFVWKRFSDGVQLRVRMIAPPDHSPEDFAPSVLFYFGGMWALQNDTEFVSWALHLASRGIVCLLPEYRTYACFDVGPEDIIQDAKDVWEWTRHNAAGLGIDLERITVAGSDAGGLMALNVAMQPMVEEHKWWKPGSKDVLPVQPAAVAILRGVVDVDALEARTLGIQAAMKNTDSINPSALLRRKLPPLFCAHGLQDPLLDGGMREWFCKQWEKLGNKVEFLLCTSGDHTLTQFDVNPLVFEQILISWEEFMAALGIWPEAAQEFDPLME